MSHVPARIAVAAALVLAVWPVPAAAPSPTNRSAFVVVGPLLKLKGDGMIVRVKNGNDAGKAFLDHKVVVPVAKSIFVVPDVNGDGNHDQDDFTRGDKVKITKKVVPPGPSGADPQKLGPAKITLLSADSQPPQG